MLSAVILSSGVVPGLVRFSGFVSVQPGNTKGGKYHCTIDLLFDWFGLVCFAYKNKKFSSHTADSKPVKQEVNGTVILPPLVFPGSTIVYFLVAYP
jgi:hypothetical protein